jgi:drug/metabolite transporter (DMT)-like permease
MAAMTTGTSRLFAWLAITALVALAAGWQIVTRLGVTTTLGPLDVAMLRYTVPALLLAPLWWRIGLCPPGLGRGRLALIVLGGGAPFGLLAISGAQLAPAADMATIMSGGMPLAVAALAALVLGERPSGRAWFGFVVIAIGLALLIAPTVVDRADGSWRGHVLFLTAGVVWAVYTVAYRGSGLTPWTAAAVVSAWSALIVIPLWLWTGTARVFAAPWHDVALQLVWQGVLAGVGGLWLYGVAIQAFGASRAAVSGALVPPAVALGAWVILGEMVDTLTLAALAGVTMGVTFASGALDRRSH